MRDRPTKPIFTGDGKPALSINTLGGDDNEETLMFRSPSIVVPVLIILVLITLLALCKFGGG